MNDDATLQSAPAPLLFPLGTVIGASDTAFIGGGQIGYNWQFGRWVTGIEGDISGTTHNYSVTAGSTLIPGASLTATSKINWLATVTGRLGYTYADWLLYAKGGLAVMDATYGGSATVPGVGTLVVNSFSDTRTGWTVGAGVEKQWMGAWSWKAEYNYMNFGDTYSSTTTPPVGISVNKVDTEIHAVKLGLNYRFTSR